MQSKKYSLIETTTNVLAGLIISILVQMAIYPVLNIEVKFSQNIIITVVFTLVSILRGYILRRLFKIL